VLRSLLDESIRTHKPREHGVTMVLDVGLGPNSVRDLAINAGAHVDYAKIAWGSALITGNLEEKLASYREFSITPLFGGTLFEYAYLRNKAEELFQIVKGLGVHIEISDGVAHIPPLEKLRWIERFAKHVEVFSEVGRKRGQVSYDWAKEIKDNLAAGARKIVIEGREVGPVGQEIRVDLVDHLLEIADSKLLVFEALERAQQVFLIKKIGPNVNLGNIRPADLLTVESFRRGLKEHTLLWGAGVQDEVQ
jgi:phosphosulfolactate synthase